jgi:hypothetical protein
VLTKVGGGPDVLVGAGRGHPDVGDHDVGVDCLDEGQESRQVDGRPEELEGVPVGDQFLHALT